VSGLAALGWTPELAAAFAPHAERGHEPARVTVEHRGAHEVRTEAAEGTAVVSGRFRFEAATDGFPAVGDWVAISGSPADDAATIHALLPRRTSFTRKVAGLRSDGQVVAANIDVIFVAMALDGDFNVRRLERYVAVAWSSGAEPVVLLTKADRAADVEGMTLAVEAVAPGVPVHPVSALTGLGLESVAARLGPGRTAAILGSSGVGKSTLINVLVGTDLLATAAVRADDDRGRHTTTHRQLVVLPGGACIVDTPGMRELGMWEGGDGLDEAFADIDELAGSCRFRDCRHEREPGCAVTAAIAAGDLPSDRLRARRKLEREAAHIEGRRTAAERVEAKRFARLVRNVAADAMARKTAPYGRER
jgi:ribosome biogenesis GTPase / thiamine phosphate phosphatase